MSKCRLIFSKTGRAKYISHLDLMRTFQRIFMRADVKIKHTEGFNPHAYISIALPLSVGCESICEVLDFEMENTQNLSELSSLLTKVSPEGICILDAYESQSKSKDIRWIKVSGTFVYDNGVSEYTINSLTDFFKSTSMPVVKKGKKGLTEIDIIPNLKSIEFYDISGTEIGITAVVAAQNPSLNPELLKAAINQHVPELTPDFSSFIREEIYYDNMQVFR